MQCCFRVRKFLLPLVLVCALAPSLAAKACPTKQADKAEAMLDRVATWKQFLSFYKTFGTTCADSESLPGALETLFTKHWAAVPDFAELAARQPEFKTFVLDHIDSSMGNPKAIEDNAAKNCPAGLNRVCGEIKAAARRALDSD